MAESSVRHSPLGHARSALDATPPGVRIREVPFLTQLNLRLDPSGPAAVAVDKALGGALPTLPNTAMCLLDVVVLWLGPDEWLVVAPDGSSSGLEQALRDAIGAEPGAVVDLSAHRTTVELAGPRAREVLAKGCSLDLHPSVFTEDSCAQVLLARAPVLLLARGGDRPGYWLLVRSSFAGYVADWLLDACIEYSQGDS